MPFYQLKLNENANYDLITQHAPVSGRGRALEFIDKLSDAIGKKTLNPSINSSDVKKALKEVKAHVEKYRFYTLLSWIPFTTANAFSKAAEKLKEQIWEMKWEEKRLKNQKIVEEALQNTTDCDNFFKMPERLMDLIKISRDDGPFREHLKPNEAVLYYAKCVDKKSQVVEKFYWHSSRFESDNIEFKEVHTVVPFIVVFNKEAGIVKIDDSTCLRQKRVRDGLLDLPKQDIFNQLLKL